MKFRLALTAALLSGIMGTAVFAQPQAADMSVVINGERINTATMEENGRSLVPLRDILEKMGADIDWDANTKTVTASLNGQAVGITVGAPVMTGTKGEIKLDAPAQIIDGRTYVPTRAISEGLGAKVSWNAESKTITINTKAAKSEQINLPDTEADDIVYENTILSGSHVVMPLKVTYPKFDGNGRTARKINDYIASDAQNRLDSYKNSNTKRLYNLYQAAIRDKTRDKLDGFTYNADYDIVYNKNGILSLYITEYIVSDKGTSLSHYGLTLSTLTGKVLTADELDTTLADKAKAAFIKQGYRDTTVNKLSFGENDFYVAEGNVTFIAAAGKLAVDEQQASVAYKPESPDAPLSSNDIYLEDGVSEGQLLSQTNDIVMKLKVTYPQFKGGTESKTAALNTAIKTAVEKELENYKQNTKADALAAYKAHTDKQTGSKKAKFTPWLWTNTYEVKYMSDKYASVLERVYTKSGNGEEKTLYNAYMVDLNEFKIVDVDTLIPNKAATDSKARAAFKRLIESDRLNFYTDVFKLFSLEKAQKYITEDGVTYMFEPGVLASVSNGVIEVTVPLA